jgi:geranylgeranyl reductase family protein
MNGITYDATIVGSGPAGTTAAIHLASRGLRVCLVEKNSHPRNKVCGGGVAARAVNFLPVPLDAAIEEPCFRFELHFWRTELDFIIQRDQPIIYMVMRSNMDALLLAEAKKLGVEVFENTAVIDVAQESGQVTLITNREPILSRFVIAADGVASVVARKGGWSVNHSLIPALECEVSVDLATLERFRGTARFDLDNPSRGYSWVFPKNKHLSVGVLTMAHSAAGLKKSFYAYLERLDIRNVEPLKLHGALIPVKPRPGLLARGRILLVGDAAGLAEPISAEGISNALLSGMLAARAITDGAMNPDRVTAIYQRDLEISILPELGIAKRHAQLLYEHRHMRKILFRLMGELFCEKLIDVTMGERSFSSYGGPLRLLVKMLSRVSVKPATSS